MADFSFLSDTDESAVEEILAEAADHVALKQIAALNLSSVSDSVLPNHLESRFRRLKTFPSIHSAPNPPESTPPDSGSTSQTTPLDKPGSGSAKTKSRSGSSRRRRSRSPSPSSSSSAGSSTSWLEKAEKAIGSVSPPSKKTDSGSGSGCLWWSPKRALRKLSFTKRSGGGNDAVLEGIGKEQQRILKRAAKEEMKISAEAEKIVNWAKHVSARMEDFRVTDGDDDDELNHYK